jgi:hypothetical protein
MKNKAGEGNQKTSKGGPPTSNMEPGARAKALEDKKVKDKESK